VAYSQIMTQLAAQQDSTLLSQLARQLPGQLSYFMAGALFYYYPSLLERRPLLWVLAAAAVLLLQRHYPLPWLEPLALATAVICAGRFCYLGNAGKYGDFSYGVYILHFPLIQLLVASGTFHNQPWLFLGTVLLLTGGGAILLWYRVEQPFLRRHKQH